MKKLKMCQNFDTFDSEALVSSVSQAILQDIRIFNRVLRKKYLKNWISLEIEFFKRIILGICHSKPKCPKILNDELQ